MAPILDTPRLRLRPHSLHDFAPIAALYQTERSRFIGGPMKADAAWRGFMDAIGQWPILGCGGWGIEIRGNGAYVGQIAVIQPIEFPEPELGWLLFAGYEGRGFAYEAARRAKAFAFENIKVASLVSYIDPANARSIHLAERLGATLEPDAATPNGAPTLVYRHISP